MFLIFFLFGCQVNKLEKKQACFESDCFSVEVAKTASQQEQGLMYRKSIGEKEGMLFLFNQEAKHAIWMKNMNFSLDIIWLDKDYQVIDIQKNTPPCKNDPCLSYLPDQKSSFVLEIKADQVDQLNIKKGDKMVIK